MIEDKVSKNEERLRDIQEKLDSYEVIPYETEKKSCQEV
jgi:hypothetical protein